MQQNETMGGGVVSRAQSKETPRVDRVQQELASLREMRDAGRRIQDEVIDAVVATMVAKLCGCRDKAVPRPAEVHVMANRRRETV